MRLLAPPGIDPEDDPLAGPRMLVNGCLLGIVVWAVILFGIFAIAEGYVLHPFGGMRGP